MQPTKLRETQNQPPYHQSTPSRKLINHHCSSTVANTAIKESQRNFQNPPKETHLQLDPKQICIHPYSTTSLSSPENPNEPKLSQTLVTDDGKEKQERTETRIERETHLVKKKKKRRRKK